MSRLVALTAALIISLPCIVSAQAVRAGLTRPVGPNFDLGLELAELIQNRFRDLGPSNFTVIAGQRAWWWEGLDWLGWRVLGINVDLANEHLRDDRSVCCISGDRSNLEGELSVFRTYVDAQPVALEFFHLQAVDEFVLSVRPVVGLGIGYTRWLHRDRVSNDAHDLRGWSLNASLRLRSEILGWVFVENPVFDAFCLFQRNRSPSGTVGDATLERPERLGLFGWFNAGIFLHF